MPGFILADAVEELTFDFGEYGPKGTIPEPTAKQIQAFRKTIAEMLADMLPEGNTDDQSPEEMRKVLIEVIGRDQTEIQQKILHAIADVCSDEPSFEVLDKLPYRHQQAFSGWISGVFLLPQTPMPATNGSVAGQGTGPSSTSRSAN